MFGKLNKNTSLLGQIGANWGQIGGKLWQIRPNWGKLGQIGANWDKLGQIGANWDKLGQIGTNWDKLGQIGAKGAHYLAAVAEYMETA